MIWDWINAFIGVVVAVAHTAYAAFPTSPVFINTSTVDAIGPWLGYAAWFFPYTSALAFLLAYIGALIIVMLVQATMRALRFVSWL